MTSSVNLSFPSSFLIEAKLIEFFLNPKVSISRAVALTPIIHSFNSLVFVFLPKIKAKSKSSVANALVERISK